MKHASTTAPSTKEADRQQFISLINEHLSELYDFVRHELAAREAAGDLTPDDLTPEDVVDDVILRAYREFARHPKERPTGDWLRRLAKERIRSEVRRQRWEREHAIHTEEDIPERSPMEEAAMLGEQILYFYQPDEDLKVEDVVQDPNAPVPGDDSDDEQRDLRRCVDVALAELPRRWRRTLVLRHVKGLTPGEIARVLHLSEAEVSQTLAQARGFLRQRLIESGCRVGMASQE
ncbi:MAG TPA: sigma-70 family RNA polymerase sigma factor [Gemmatimonadales bacterium]|jgi:RNA polymerase sigma factor (sigma-70 family)|nr:sigma-70 family RNA polymerase sigma factor [Gemmatimonadales bacterium]